jgi:hypothetical protein
MKYVVAFLIGIATVAALFGLLIIVARHTAS